MGSPLGPLLANTFVCSMEEKLEDKNKLPSFYKQCVDNTFTIMPDFNTANDFLDKWNSWHENLNFTMEIAEQDTISFVGMNITKSYEHNISTQKVHKHGPAPSLSQPCGQTLQRVFTFHNDKTVLIACHRLLPRFLRNARSFELPF